MLYDNPYFVVAGAENPLVQRRCVELIDLVGELWALPPPDTGLGLLAVEVFRAKGLDFPRTSVVSFALEMTINLL